MKTNPPELNASPVLDSTAFEQLFKQHYESLCRFAWGYTKDQDAAEEAVQDVFVRLWEKRNEIEATSTLKAYLYRSVTNHCLNVTKHNKVVQFHSEEVLATAQEQVEPANALEVHELQQQIQHAISQLPEERRKVFLMSREEGLKYQEIADKLAISIKTVENQMGKALQFMREQLKNHWVSIFIGLIIKLLLF